MKEKEQKEFNLEDMVINQVKHGKCKIFIETVL